MSVKTIEDMVLNIKNTLSKNGFPQKAVALPLERLYEAAHRDGLNFNKVLSELAAAGIEHEKTSEKVIFREKPAAQTSDSGLNMDALKNLNLPNMDFSKMNMGDMMSQAKELMKNLSPAQLLEIKKMYDNMSPEERARLMDMAKNMGK